MANLAITLCHQAIYMLTQLLKTMQQRFVQQGGIKEQMYVARTGYRQEENAELARLREENVALRQRIEQLEAYITQLTNPSDPNTPNNPSDPNTPNNPSTPNTPNTPTTPKNY